MLEVCSEDPCALQPAATHILCDWLPIMEAPPAATGILHHPIVPVPDTDGAISDGIEAFLPELDAAHHDEGRRSPASIDDKLSDEKHHESGSTPAESFTGKEEHPDKVSVDDFTAEEDAQIEYYKGEPIIRTGMYLLPVSLRL